MAIALADSLLPNRTGAPIDARTIAASAAALSGIENPYVGMHIWIADPGREVIVRTLKDQTVGAFTRKIIDTTEEAVSQSDLESMRSSLSGKADAADVTELETRVAAGEDAIAELKVSLGAAETQLNALIGEV